MSDKKKDIRETYDFDKDVKYKREQYAKDDLIDTPYNQAKRYKIAAEGVKAEMSEELEESLPKVHKKSDLPKDPTNVDPTKK